jgi:hypothetical protein
MHRPRHPSHECIVIGMIDLQADQGLVRGRIVRSEGERAGNNRVVGVNIDLAAGAFELFEKGDHSFGGLGVSHSVRGFIHLAPKSDIGLAVFRRKLGCRTAVLH